MENNLSLDQAVIMSEEEMTESLGGACKQTCKVCAESMRCDLRIPDAASRLHG